MAFDDELRGVGGWLAFFLVTLGLITPGFAIYSMLDLYQQPEVAYVAATFPSLMPMEWALTIISVLLCWFAVYRFMSVWNWTTVRIGIGTIWFVALLTVVGEPLLLAAITGAPLGEVYRAIAGPELIRPFVYCAIWTAYLLKSERVRNTYGRNDDETAEVFA